VGLGPRLTGASPGPGALDAVTRWPVGAVAAGVVRNDPAPAGPRVVGLVGDVDRAFAWASVTKVLVALGVLVAAEQGVLRLDDPAGPPGSTVRHLLAHASGLGPDSPEPLTAPGRRRIYSNVGYEVLANTVALHAGMPFADYLVAAVVQPLALVGTGLETGASPASGARGPLRDLMALTAELQAPSLVAPDTMARATTVAFPGLAGVLPGFGRFDPCDWGLGVEVKGAKAPHWTGTTNSPATFGHFGQAGGFVWVDPVTGLGCASLSDRDFGPWAAAAWPRLADAVVAHPWEPGPGTVAGDGRT